MHIIFNPMLLYYLHYFQLDSVTMAIYHTFFGIPFRVGRYWVDRSGSGQGQVALTGECGNETSVSVKGWKISCLAEDMLASQKGLCSVEFSCVFIPNFFRSDLLQELQVCLSVTPFPFARYRRVTGLRNTKFWHVRTISFNYPEN